MASSECAVLICDLPVYGRGWCKAHHQRWLTNGDPGTTPVRRKRPGSRCSVSDCGRPHYARGWCRPHYVRWSNKKPAATGAFIVHPVPVQALTYHTTHKRIAAERGPASDQSCVACGGEAAQWAYQHNDDNELTSEWGPYSSDVVASYEPMCRSCHQKFDRAMADRRVGMSA